MGQDFGFALIGLGALLVIYLFASFTLSIIAKKTNTQDPWLAWVPVGNLVLMARIAEKPFWWGLLLLIPYVGVVFMVLLWMKIAERRNCPSWYGILMLVPIVNLIILCLITFSDTARIE